MMIIVAVTISHAITGYTSWLCRLLMKYGPIPSRPEDRLGDDGAADQHAEVDRRQR